MDYTSHWLVYNLPPTITGLPENLAPIDPLPSGVRQGRNDFNRTGYMGAAVELGAVQRFLFQLYALNAKILAHPGMTKTELIREMESHVVARGRLIGNVSLAVTVASA